ncbi:MAG: hypothetical protein EXR98_22520 [Gemmataceae bacterium]|nr:hypothetical protein [Gemmataceae bacterium]
MRIRVIDLDGSITAQDRVLQKFQPDVYDLNACGPRLRLACRWNRFYRFERRLDRLFGSKEYLDPWISLLGSGDFHHLTLALLRRLRHPFNLLVLDKHPDWVRGSPILHCDTWLHHAAQLPNVRRIFHLGGDADFDNTFRLLAPRSDLESGKIVAFPSTRRFHKGFWKKLPHQPLRSSPDTLLERERLEDVLWPYLDDLDRWPLYISLDKDVMWLPESVVNWESGVLDLTEVQEILQFFLKAAGNDLIGMDIVGDWSPVRTRGLVRRMLHYLEHPRQNVEAEQARLSNERTNLMLLKFLKHDPVAESVTFPSHSKSV